MLDLSSLDGPRTRTIRLTGALDGFELELRHVGITEREKFRFRMMREGIFNKAGNDTNPGRTRDFMLAFIEQFVVGWTVPDRFRGADTKDENPPYKAAELVNVLDYSPASFKVLHESASEELDFFSSSSAGSSD